MSNFLFTKPIMLCLVAGGILTISGCKITSKKMDKNFGGSGSVLASIEGIEPEDKKDMGAVKYWLTCKQISITNQIKIEGKVKEVAGKELLAFDGTKIKDGMKCTLALNGATEPQDKKIKWHTDPETPGLYYASSWSTVTDRKLKLQVYKLFSTITDAPTFNATFLVQPGEGDSDRNLPSTTSVIGGLTCTDKDNENELSEKGAFSVDDQGVAKVVFDLNVATMEQIESCNELSLFDNETKKTYQAILGDLVIKGAKGEVKEFKNSDDKPFDLYWLLAKINLSVCLHKHNDRNCLLELPDANSFWLAKISFSKTIGEDVTTKSVFVSDLNFRSNDQKEITLKDIKTRFEENKLRLYTDDFYEKIIGESKIPFDEKFLKGEADKQTQSEVDIALELDGFDLENINSVFVHKFAKVDQATIEKQKSAVWLASLTAEIAGEDKTIYISGVDNNLQSKTNPLPNGFLDLALVQQNITDKASDKWKFYQFKGAVFSASTCAVSLEEAFSDMSGRDLSTVENADKIAECEVEIAALTTVEKVSNPQYYLWGWNEIEIK